MGEEGSDEVVEEARHVCLPPLVQRRRPAREIGNLLPNNQRQRRTCYSLCHILYPVSSAHTRRPSRSQGGSHVPSFDVCVSLIEFLLYLITFLLTLLNAGPAPKAGRSTKIDIALMIPSTFLARCLEIGLMLPAKGKQGGVQLNREQRNSTS